ncbi:hypothetical protein MP228_003951 [Amoeboaphelidium protococcarum]|nr:hypothetical protein MP228_003951 [Amoeboaphelidium protococcarum]
MNNVSYRVISYEGGFVPQMYLQAGKYVCASEMFYSGERIVVVNTVDPTVNGKRSFQEWMASWGLRTQTVMIFTQETSSAKMRASITNIVQDKAEKHVRKVLKGRKIKRVDRHVLIEMVKRRLQFSSDDIKVYYVYLELLEKKALAIEESKKQGDKFGWKRLKKVFRNIMLLN